MLVQEKEERGGKGEEGGEERGEGGGAKGGGKGGGGDRLRSHKGGAGQLVDTNC